MYEVFTREICDSGYICRCHLDSGVRGTKYSTH
jgi:hypothetical protein